MPRSPSQQPPQRARLFSSASWPLIGAGQLCHAPPAAMAASGIAVRQGLAAYHQERGNLATLSSLQRPPRATLSPLASRPLIGAGKLCHAPPTAATATGGADLQGPAAYHQERGNISGYTVLFGLRPFILLQGKSFNGRLDRAVARSTHHGLRRLFSTGLRASMGPGPEPRS